jgi:hypothetical protein
MVVIETVQDLQELCATELAAAIDIFDRLLEVERDPAKELSSMPGPRHPDVGKTGDASKRSEWSVKTGWWRLPNIAHLT